MQAESFSEKINLRTGRLPKNPCPSGPPAVQPQAGDEYKATVRMSDFDKDFVNLARLSIEGKSEDVAALLRRTLKGIVQRRPDLAQMVSQVLTLVSASPARAVANAPLPVDLDSRLELLRREPVPTLPLEPTWPPSVLAELEAVVKVRQQEEQLANAGLVPTRSLLFVGPPGVGKTWAARWLALRTQRPLLTLDLSAVMSSFLGRTGNNIRVVLDFARRAPAVLLLDEFDAIAKRRDDTGEVGELKRLVTVLLQEVDEWPSSGLLVAATNHPELLDPAVWRRFERVVEFPSPSLADVKAALSRLLDGHLPQSSNYPDLLAPILLGSSFAEIARIINTAKRASIVQQQPLESMLSEKAAELVKGASKDFQLRMARVLAGQNRSQREISSLTGLSRETIRKYSGRTTPNGSTNQGK